MHYANPNYLSAALALALASVVFFFWALRRKEKLVDRFADKALIASIAPSASKIRKTVKMVMIVAAVSLAAYALARPQWGFEWKETKRKGLDMLIAIDVSKSMLATDVKPNRLERSEFGVKDLVKKLNGDRIGLIAFSGTAFLQCPMTIDYNGFLLTLEDLSVSTIPRGGTNIAKAITEAINVFSSKTSKALDAKYKVLVIITDGDDLEGDAMKAAKEALDQGIKIYCVGVGTSEGALIPAVNERGERGWVADKLGNVVKTTLNEELLKNVAVSTGGSYVRAAQSEFGLVLLYDKSISKLEKKDIEAKINKQYTERFQYFLGIALLLLLIEPFISERKRVAR